MPSWHGGEKVLESSIASVTRTVPVVVDVPVVMSTVGTRGTFDGSMAETSTFS
ncbi:predicted protein [Histoplasma capsulatum G186AR]|uniref:Uncharacterized protein n=1 Tax=Ajellomyces capsulatus (strain G186AR / H82 / ATCC MYA-2454 / RMSCC 2432) TaxID=447093 RepID=C0NXU3_AJECG|nr:uncharacterized protein HCBG_07737 [Histoplasma capsulatum G186AR]EEH03611.1 predicted protein [Histoplasma capsulatum G186AR]